MSHPNYTCPKCRNRTYVVGQMRATGGTWSKIFDVQTQKFTSVTCERCSYTEFYKTKTSAMSNVFDLFTN
ncbi:MAG: GTP-binding protein [Flavobacteriaceae bacterium]|nr:zinc ribbon domain-containing protein [Bacteroidia bacterium]MBT8286620.1 zinc ribbon domain-containing protein [Bacteroidia bacterium]NNF75145.1 GTP-binding protein [Flavobacteriaceae bacterium]NNK72161.1 GTP-binding protein [Flavobacteriaceae bacterium]